MIVVGVAYREVPPVQLCLGKFWCFGQVRLCLQEVVNYERWSHIEVPLYSLCNLLPLSFLPAILVPPPPPPPKKKGGGENPLPQKTPDFTKKKFLWIDQFWFIVKMRLMGIKQKKLNHLETQKWMIHFFWFYSLKSWSQVCTRLKLMQKRLININIKET